MSPRLWKYTSAFLLTLVVFQFYLVFSNLAHKNPVPLDADHQFPQQREPSTPAPANPPVHFDPSTSPNDAWTFNPSLHADNPGLSHAQCTAAFPALYAEIDRATAYWRGRNHTINANDSDVGWRDDAAFKIFIFDNQLRIVETKNTYQGYRDRTLAVMHQIHRALVGASAAGEKVPDVEIGVVVDDFSLIEVARPDDTTTALAFARNRHSAPQDRLWAAPDFSFWAQPPASASWVTMRRRLRLHDDLLSEKLPQVVWRGARWTNEFIRGNLLEKTKDKKWADVRAVDFGSEESRARDIMPMDDFCKYRFVVHTEGRSWSARLKYLLMCDSVPVVHELDWVVWYTHLLQGQGGKQNMVGVKRDFEDLQKKIKYYLKHEDEAQQLADEARRTFRDRYLTPAAEACYWRRLFQGWSEVAEPPVVWEEAGEGDEGRSWGEGGKRLRGLSFEEWTSVQGNFPHEGWKFNEG